MSALIPYDVEAAKSAAAKLVESASLSTLQLAAKQLEVDSEESYELAIDLRNRFAVAEKRIADFFDPLTKAANALHKSLTGARGEMMAPYSAGKNTMTQKCEGFILAQRRAKREAEEALAKIAREEQRKLQAQAEELAMLGHMKQASEVQQRATMTVAPQLPSAVPQVAGARVGDTFTATVTDIVALMKSIVEGKTSLYWEVRPGDERPLVVVDQVVLNAIAKRQQSGLRIPGVTVEEGVRISSSGGGR